MSRFIRYLTIYMSGILMGLTYSVMPAELKPFSIIPIIIVFIALYSIFTR